MTARYLLFAFDPEDPASGPAEIARAFETEGEALDRWEDWAGVAGCVQLYDAETGETTVLRGPL